MRRVVLLSIAVLASGCQLVYPLDGRFDAVAHLETAEELAGELDATLENVTINTSGNTAVPNGTIEPATISVVRQDPSGEDLVVLRADRLTINGELIVEGDRPLVILANTIVLTPTGKVSAQARGDIPGAGGGLAMEGPESGGMGVRMALVHTGGGGGGFATPGGAGGRYECTEEVREGGGAGMAKGDEALTILEGGGAGGLGANECTPEVMPPGAGGGAIQLSAFESITLETGSAIRADGGGGKGGVACSSSQDAGGSGGGAGGAIYLHAPTIENRGVIAANGGSGGGGADRTGFTDVPPTNGTGGPGMDGATSFDAVPGGAGNPPRGTGGGAAGAKTAPAAGAMSASCLEFNTGGGGGAPGRIVMRGDVTLLGDVSPDPTLLPR